MAWIKRNLFFVITVGVGLGLTLYCGYMLYSAMGENTTERDGYLGATNNLYRLQNGKPFPSKENIQVAEADASRVKTFLSDFRKAFSGFPPPPRVDDRQFKEYLQKAIFQFGADATNAGVTLNPGYTFSFSQQMNPLNYPPECIAPWMQQLEEMKAILHILYNAKINYLEHIKRTLVSANDTSDDYIPMNNLVTNQIAVVTPYRVEFRAFSAEIADVLTDFAASSNCFIVKAPFIVRSTAPLPDVPLPQAPTPTPERMYRQPPPRQPQTTFDGSEPGGFGGERRGGFRSPRPPSAYQPGPVAQAPAAPAAPVVVLREKPIFVTLYIEVVKLKAPETNAPAAAAAPKSRKTAP
jgi:hypothetical protein